MQCLFITSFGYEGYGHVSRCMAMSQAFDKLKIKSFFLLNKKNKFINKNKTAGIYDWYKHKNETISLIKNYDFVILDSIKINKNFLTKINKSCKLIYINDYHRWKIDNCIHVDWTLFASQKLNKNEIVNHKFAPLRKPFWTRKKKKVNNKIKKILILFGGSDIRNFSIKIAKLINDYNKEFKIDVISKNKLNLKNVHCHKFLNQEKMKFFLTNADLVITSGGQTLYEMACLGVPGIVISETKYDLEDSKSWAKQGSIFYAGKWNNKNILKKILKLIDLLKQRNIRQDLSYNGQKIIDGKGGMRLAKKIIEKVK